MERVTGIWLDFDQAFIYHLQKGKNDFVIVDSEVEHFHLVGGSGSSTPYGPQEAVSEKKHLERRKHQTKNYYDRIQAHLKGSLEVMITGPAEAKVGLLNHLDKANDRTFNIHPIGRADKMTTNQIKAAIRDFYKQRS
ncbi:hypothetical protein BFP97_05590 [Roseivirga sp. 4D4]|uniref:hypothetical protein n=1 Tax=Roseivirga sp. 4D4 TaxID=1889784 RepID=UPI000853716E|nr:hypothetical protein [Roseivirga sp. 4D4]OEK01014.1 hypothetical protein BFP97_05590 [Roseivirga sp. 4D4]